MRPTKTIRRYWGKLLRRRIPPAVTFRYTEVDGRAWLSSCGVQTTGRMDVSYPYKDRMMEDILSLLETLPDKDIKALIAKAQEILRERARKVRLSEEHAMGMWKDREDMQDSTAWVRNLREREWR